MTDADTDARPTRFPTAPWDHSSEGPASIVDGEAAVWDSIGDLVCAVDSHMAGNGEVEQAEDRARLIAAAGNAAHEAKKWEMGVDPVAMIEDAADTLLALDRITYALLHDAEITQGDDEEYLRQVREQIDALQKAQRST